MRGKGEDGGEGERRHVSWRGDGRWLGGKSFYHTYKNRFFTPGSDRERPRRGIGGGGTPRNGWDDLERRVMGAVEVICFVI